MGGGGWDSRDDSLERRGPIGDHLQELATLQVGLDKLPWYVGQAHAIESRAHRGDHVVERQLTLDTYAELVCAFRELPGIHRTRCREPQVDAVVAGQVMRCFRRGMAGEVVG